MSDTYSSPTEAEQDIPVLSDPVEISCVVCGTHGHSIICSARDVQVHYRYLRRFHKRRLNLDPQSRVDESALEDRINFTQDYATDIVSCHTCGLIFRNPRPPKGTVTATYATDEYDEEHLNTAHETDLDLYRNKANVLTRWLPHRNDAHLVEVGSFVGSFLAAGRELGWTVLGVDPGKQAAEFCKAKGLNVYRGTLPDLQLPAESLDGVTIWNTFDQLPDPKPTVTAASRLLRPGGLLVIRVPNGACFASAISSLPHLGRWKARWLKATLAWNNLLMFPYLFGYSVATADRLMDRNDFQRIAVYPDTLVTLADPHVKWWAALEERMIKLACRGVARIEALLGSPTYVTAPWLDIYYRKGRSRTGWKEDRAGWTDRPASATTEKGTVTRSSP